MRLFQKEFSKLANATPNPSIEQLPPDFLVRSDISCTFILETCITLQSWIRKYNAMNSYAINHLENNKLRHSLTYIEGNDPKISLKNYNIPNPKDMVALIGTSGLRIVLLACKLKTNIIPKIILVDISLQVTSFWKALQDFLSKKELSDNQELFMKNLPDFLHKNEELFLEHSEKASIFIKKIIDKKSFEYFKKVILHATVIKQSWEDEDTFHKINNYLKLHDIKNILVYPSNIVSCEYSHRVDRILKNIELLSPNLSIHTNRCLLHLKPEKVFMITDQKTDRVKSTLFYQKSCRAGSYWQDPSYLSMLIATLLIALFSIVIVHNLFSINDDVNTQRTDEKMLDF